MRDLDLIGWNWRDCNVERLHLSAVPSKCGEPGYVTGRCSGLRALLLFLYSSIAGADALSMHRSETEPLQSFSRFLLPKFRALDILRKPDTSPTVNSLFKSSFRMVDVLVTVAS